MKFLPLGLSMAVLMLSGCGSLPTDVLTSNMLSVAPQSDRDVLHPEWGDATIVARSGVEGPYGEKNAYQPHSLESFLAKNNLEYEVLPGGYKMIRLMDTIKFQTGSAQVSNQSAYWLNTIGRYIASQPGIDVVIDGHADSSGGSAFNDTLSMQRADAVKQRLVSNQVNKQLIFTRGYGETAPACSNSTTSGKACNRRAELRFILSTE
ncbi:OmpA family protein [Vibrio sp. 404]|uniref:OmpA family protein n=1 Tax=Vibrio marinisediminis TaxID=2758441 RepID=A0A7W2IVC8_9VIBR|nr:OmpA family protein [Vibrio marinisediminis]MBA5763957.1 OmpA family protein [Vibrio marinisediminis]